jgi:hypothetical protein
MLGVMLIAQFLVTAHTRADSVYAACEPIELSVVVSNAGSVAAQLVAPSLAPLDLLQAAATPHMPRDTRAAPLMTVEYRYVMVTEHGGAYTIPAFEARLGSLTARSQPIHVVVRGDVVYQPPTVITRARIDTGGSFNPRSAMAPETVYVGQQADYEVAVFMNARVRDRMRRNPTFYPPDMQSMLAYDLASASAAQRQAGGSRCFDALVYRRALFPLQAGRLVIPPAQLTYALSIGSSFFSREESHDRQTDSAVVVAIDPPMEGQPAEFDGAVGDLQVTARVDPGPARVGDPVTLTVRVSGAGNVKLFPRPHLAIPWASVVPSDERVQVDSAGKRIRGSKDFAWIITPRIAGELDVPPVRYSFFNPDTRRYEVSTSAPARVRVEGGALAAVDTTHRENVLTIRREYRGAVSEPLPSHPAFWLVLAIAPLPALGARLRSALRKRARQLRPSSRLDRSLRATSDHPDGRLLRRAFVGVLVDRLGLGSDALTHPGALRRALRRAGVSAAAATDAEALLRELDTAAFSPDGALAPDAGDRAKHLMRQIDDEALARSELPLRVVSLALLASLSVVGVSSARQSNAAEVAFRTGVTAYDAHDYAAARDAFATTVGAESRAADAWANLGTAAWASADTLRAVVGWRHALGIEPLAGDARERLELVHGLGFTSPGYVPPAPLGFVAALMALCWIAGCGLAHPAARARVAHTTAWIAACGVSAAILGLGAIELQARLSGRNLAVAGSNLTLNTDPALAASRGATVVIGEIVRVSGRQGAWVHVALADGREGWAASDRLAGLDALPPRRD